MHLRSIVRSNMLGNAVSLHKVGKDIDRIFAPDISCHTNGHAHPSVLVDDQHQLGRAGALGAIKHEVPRTHVAEVLWSLADARAVIQG